MRSGSCCARQIKRTRPLYEVKSRRSCDLGRHRTISLKKNLADAPLGDVRLHQEATLTHSHFKSASGQKLHIGLCVREQYLPRSDGRHRDRIERSISSSQSVVAAGAASINDLQLKDGKPATEVAACVTPPKRYWGPPAPHRQAKSAVTRSAVARQPVVWYRVKAACRGLGSGKLDDAPRIWLNYPLHKQCTSKLLSDHSNS